MLLSISYLSIGVYSDCDRAHSVKSAFVHPCLSECFHIEISENRKFNR